MSNKTIINFHIGLPTIALNAVALASSQRLIPRRKGRKLLTTREFRSKLRSFVNDQSVTSYKGAEISESIARFRKSLHSFQTVVASQHAMLGAPKLFAQSKDYAGAAKRMQNLSEMFEAFDVTFHILLRSQLHVADVLQRDPTTRDVANLMLKAPPLWSSLVGELANRCSDRNFIVWDADYDAQTMLGFCLAMYAEEPDRLTAVKLKDLQSLLSSEETLRRMFSKTTLLTESERATYHQFYQNDLAQLDSLSNVFVVQDASELLGHS